MINKTLIVLTLIIVYSSNELISQTGFPDENISQKWEYVTWNFWGGECEKRIIKNGGIESICEGQYIEIFDCDENEQNCSLIGYYRIKGDSILTRSIGYWNGQSHVDSVNCNTPFGLTYDFGANIGEELECALNTSYAPYQKEFWIAHLEPIQYEGIERTTRMVNYKPYPNSPNVIYSMNWIDGIGSNIHPFYSFSCIGDHCEQEQQVTKVFKNDKLIYQDTILNFSFPCTDWITSVNSESLIKADVTLLPNPAKRVFTIDFVKDNSNFLKLDVFDVQGKNLISIDDYTVGTAINIENLKSGVYIIQICDGTYVQNAKLIKE